MKFSQMSTAALLSKLDFANIVRNTPLISFDLLIENTKKQYLVGLRNNKPAKGFWFVPGGRIRKNENFRAAFLRILSDELGIAENVLDPQELVKLTNPSGTLFIHHYPNDNDVGLTDVHTHYIVFAISVSLTDQIKISPDNQHAELKWLTSEELKDDKDVHPNTKAYFTNNYLIPNIKI